MADVTIVEFDRSLATAFADLNYEWIAKQFTIEDHDRDQLDDPEQEIIEPGGQIFFAIAGEVAG